MKVIVCVVLAGIIVTIKTTALKSKQVNLALETVLNFDKKDRAADLEVIDKVQNFLEQIKNGMSKASARRSTKREVTFTDFILEAAKILKELDDIDLEDAYVTTNDETRRYINRESAFQDLFENSDMRRFVSDQLDDAKEMPATALRQNLDFAIEFIESQKKTGDTNDLLDLGNTLYDGASDKFIAALRNLDKLRRAAESNLERVLKDTLRSLVFDHYAKLDGRVRDELINMVKHYWRAFSDKSYSKHTKTKFKMADATPFRHKGGKRHEHKNSPLERTYPSKSKPRKHQKESYKNNEKYKGKHKSEHEVFLTDIDLNKLIKVDEEKEKPKNRFSVYKDTTRNPKAKKTRNKDTIGRAKSSPHLHRGTAKKHDRTEDRERIDLSDLAESSEVVMGGQIIRDVHFRGESSSEQISEGSDTAESSTEEIVIQHSNIVDIGLSRKTPGRINITFVSSEIHKTDGSKEKVNKESMSIENQDMRKSNMNDTLETVPSAKDTPNLNTLIKNIEKQLEDVKDQVEYVKNLTNTKSSDNKEPKSYESAKNLTGPEIPKAGSEFSFRAQDDSDFINSSPEVENYLKKEATESTSALTTDTTDAFTKNESKINDAIENTSERIKVNNNTNPNKSIEQEIVETSQTHDANKANDVKDVTDAPNHIKIIENDKDDHNDEDLENAITESNSNITDTMTVDVKIDV